VEKKTPETLAAILKPDQVQGRHVRLMFQDEARFGRMVRIRRCWAPAPYRPVVNNGYQRQFVYVYGAVSPVEGEMDWLICPMMNTERMEAYLAQVAQAHPGEFIVMVVDGASSHVAKALVVPENIRLLRLPAYAPELNRKSMFGMNCGKRNSPTECLPIWPASPVSWNAAYPHWPPTLNACAALPHGLGSLVST